MRFMVLLMLEAALVGCRAASHQYLVTATPLDLLNHSSHPGFCVAVDPSNPQGVWWWEPGRSGCASRSTGPEPFAAEMARVVSASGISDVRFKIAMHSSDSLDVRLTVDGNSIRREPSGERVNVERRPDLQVPFICCPAQRTAR